MKILLIRHATAVPRGRAGMDDTARSLTPRGAKRFRRAAQGLARVVDRPDALLTSPWLRARETADITAVAFQGPAPVETAALTGAPFEDLLAALAELGEVGLVALVGHEPWMSELLARLTQAGAPDRLEFRKGGAALVDCPNGPSEGGRLVFYLPPRVLRRLGS
jgi:phosphohistidine phosphatase